MRESPISSLASVTLLPELSLWVICLLVRTYILPTLNHWIVFSAGTFLLTYIKKLFHLTSKYFQTLLFKIHTEAISPFIIREYWYWMSNIPYSTSESTPLSFSPQKLVLPWHCRRKGTHEVCLNFSGLSSIHMVHPSCILAPFLHEAVGS